MRRATLLGAVLLATSSLLSCSASPPGDRGTLADRLHRRAVVFDAHAHPKSGEATPLKLGVASGAVEVELPTLKAGGVDAVFFSVPFLIRGREAPESVLILDDLRSLFEEIERCRDLAEIARSASDVRRIHGLGKRAILLGIEAKDPFGGNLGLLERYRSAGVRMITLTLGSEGPQGSQSQDPANLPLGPFVRSVVEEMNRLGMIVDVSHLSDRQQMDVVLASTAPVVASHSNARALNDAPRHISDAVIQAMAARGGVVCVTFYPGHVSPRHPGEPATVEDLTDHIDHIVRVAGTDHVGFGSDFLGGEAHTLGLESAAGLPALTQSLLSRGYSPADIEKILGGNLLRVLEAVDTPDARRGPA